MKHILKFIIVCLFVGISSNPVFGIMPDRTYRFYPEKLGLVYKDLTVITTDSLKIKTWFSPLKQLFQRQN